MKRSLPLLLSLFMLTNYSFKFPNEYADRSISVKLDSMHIISNNKVGHNWDNFLTINEQVIRECEEVTIKLKKRASLIIEAHAIEQDKYHNDVGTNKMTFTYSDLIAIEKSRFEIRVKVIENGGKYAGNIAEWRYIFELAKGKR